MDPGIIELIATAGAGAVAGIGSYYLTPNLKTKRLTFCQGTPSESLAFDPSDKDIINIFTLNKDKRISRLRIMEVLNQTVSTTRVSTTKAVMPSKTWWKTWNAFGNPLKNAARMVTERSSSQLTLRRSSNISQQKWWTFQPPWICLCVNTRNESFGTSYDKVMEER